jgi:gamma-glutamylcyclotransferase (GGCT)/AIG2-like uncharacterized protein YtfP
LVWSVAPPWNKSVLRRSPCLRGHELGRASVSVIWEDVCVAETTVLLFSYGTLRQENVQLASFGRILSGSPDALPGYATTMIEITDPEVVAKSGMKFHPMVVETGNPSDEVPGALFLITEAELAAADAYEVSDYRRIEVSLRSGRRAWVYVRA